MEQNPCTFIVTTHQGGIGGEFSYGASQLIWFSWKESQGHQCNQSEV